MADIDLVTGSVLLPLWTVAIFACVFVAACLLAFKRSGTRTAAAALLRVALIFAVAAAAWIFADRSAQREEAAERRALDARASELTLQTLAPGSPLACLDANAGETIENACEKLIFGGPESVAAANAYVGARLAFLADGLNYANRVDPDYERVLAGLRRAIESDRFGLVAHILAMRDGCTPDKCEVFALLRDPAVIKANLTARTYEKNVERYAAIWSEPKAAPAAAANPVAAPPAVATGPKIDFPSAASIPAVSIMNEPAPTPPTETAPQAPRRPAPVAAPVAPARKPATNGVAPPANAAASPR